MRIPRDNVKASAMRIISKQVVTIVKTIDKKREAKGGMGNNGGNRHRKTRESSPAISLGFCGSASRQQSDWRIRRGREPDGDGADCVGIIGTYELRTR